MGDPITFYTVRATNIDPELMEKLRKLGFK